MPFPPPLVPLQILPGLYVGGAVTADSHHLLRHMGITHIVNATEEVLPPPASAGFQVRASLSREGEGPHCRVKGGGCMRGLHEGAALTGIMGRDCPSSGANRVCVGWGSRCVRTTTLSIHQRGLNHVPRAGARDPAA